MKPGITYFNQPNQRINFSYIKGVSLAEAIYAPNFELPRHTHAHAGFCLILQGAYTESEGNRRLECKPLSVKFNPAGDIHSNSYGSNPVHIFVTELKKEWLSGMGVNSFLKNNPAVFRSSSLTWLMMKLRREFNSRDAESEIAIEGLLLEIIAETSRNRTKLVKDAAPQWLKQAKECLDDQFSANLNLSVIAKLVGVHPVYLASSFRQHYKSSIGEYIRKKRIEYACDKLSKSKDELIEIALQAGFSNQAHFSRIFKKITGLTPAQYRSATR